MPRKKHVWNPDTEDMTDLKLWGITKKKDDLIGHLWQGRYRVEIIENQMKELQACDYKIDQAMDDNLEGDHLCPLS